MTWLNKYLASTYVDGGRELPRLDCYGLVRMVRAELFGKSDLPAFGHILPRMPVEFTRAYRERLDAFEQCAPEPGAIACVFRGRVCEHVAIVVEIDGRLAVLETGSKTGPTWSRIAEFERRSARVIYYRDRP
jgi:hypothetical protein